MDLLTDPLGATLDRLAELCDDANAIVMRELADQWRAGALQVLLAGGAKRGKSTLGNALLGVEVLPTGVRPVTAIATEVRAGSPERAEVTFVDGNVFTTTPEKIDRFITEGLNSGNYRKVTGVAVWLPHGMLDPKLVLVDSPGVNSVLAHTTKTTETSYPSLDAALVVLTAEPPPSPSEVALFKELDSLAARTFVVLNKADLLSTREVAEAAQTVRRAIGAGADVDVWVCSARDAVQAAADGDRTRWDGSGMRPLLHALLKHLTDRREQTLRASIAAAARWITEREIDRRTVTAATLDALDKQRPDLVSQFARKIDEVDQARNDASALLHDAFAAARGALDKQAEQQIVTATQDAWSALDDWLANHTNARPSQAYSGGLEAISKAVRSALDLWRADWQVRLEALTSQARARQQSLVDAACDGLGQSAAELLGVRLNALSAPMPPPARTRLRYDFAPDVGWSRALMYGLRRHALLLPRGWVAGFLKRECRRLTNKHVGRAHLDFQRWLQEATGKLTDQLETSLADALAQLRAAVAAGEAASRGPANGHDRERRRLQYQVITLKLLAERLHPTGQL